MSEAWIIGNGPSLTPEQLDAIDCRVSCATNRIHLIYPKTIWRPTYYVRAENPYATSKIVEEDLVAVFKVGALCYLNRGFESIWWNHFKDEAPGNQINFLPDACEHTYVHYNEPHAPTEWHSPLCSFGSSLHVAIQLAVQHGYGPLILLGCDMGYQDGAASHFDPTYEAPYYEEGKLPAMKPADLANGDCLLAHQIAARCSPVPIYNATPGGQLEVYPRISLEAALRGDYAEATRGLQPGQREPRGSQVDGDTVHNHPTKKPGSSRAGTKVRA